MKKYTIIAIALLLIGVGAGYLWSTKDTPEIVTGATGSSFHLQHEYVTDTPASGAISTTTTTSVASTTPIYFTANSTSTVKVLTSGVSDLRLNLIVHATTTTEGAGPEISIAPLVEGSNGIDKYNNTVISTSGVAQVATPIEVYYLDAQATSTRTVTLSPDADNFFAGSVQISNFNSPYTILDIGADVATDIHLEIVKVVPNQ